MRIVSSEPELDELALWLAFLYGDISAFDELMKRLGPRAIADARRVLGNLDDASDAYQEAVRRLLQQKRNYDAEQSEIGAYFRGIVYRVSLEMYRKRQRSRGQSLETTPVAGHEPDPAKFAEMVELCSITQHCWYELAAMDRYLLRLNRTFMDHLQIVIEQIPDPELYQILRLILPKNLGANVIVRAQAGVELPANVRGRQFRARRRLIDCVQRKTRG